MKKQRMIVQWILILCGSLVLSGCGKKEHHYQGYVENENIYLASPYSGRLVSVFVERGQWVKKGQLLFKLDENPQALQIKQAFSLLDQARQVYADLKKGRRPSEIDAIMAQIGQADAQLKLAMLRVKRNQELFERHVVARDGLDAAIEYQQEVQFLKAQFEANLVTAKQGSRENQIKAQLAQMKSLTSKMNQAQWELDQKSIYAPLDGILFDIYYKQSEFVDQQHPIAAFLAPDYTRIEFFVPASALPALQVGQSITFDCEGCSKHNAATICYISPQAEYIPPLVYSRENQDKLVFRVKAKIAHAERFKAGQPVIVTSVTHD